MLEGRLSEFRLPDVFKLLSFTEKSGALAVSGSGTEGRVVFTDGAVVFATGDTRRPALTDRLSRRATLGTDEQERLLAAERTGEFAALADALADASLDVGTVREVVREQAVDVVCALLRLDDGRFTFDTAPNGVPGPVKLSAEELITEGARRLAQSERVRTQLGDGTAALGLAPALEQAEVTVTAEQWRLLALVDGTRSAADVVALTGDSEYAVLELLAGLVVAGLVVVAQRTPADAPAAPPARRAAPADARRTDEAAQERLATLRRRIQAAEPAPAEPAPAEPAPAETAPATTESESGAAATEPEPAPAITRPAPPPATIESAPAPTAAAAASVAASGVDRASVARELAALGLDDEPLVSPDDAAPRRLTRDQEVSKGLLLRLIDGVKGM